MRGESMKDKSKKSTYSTTFGIDPKKPSNFLDGSSLKWRDVIKNCGLKNPTAVRVW